MKYVGETWRSVISYCPMVSILKPVSSVNKNVWRVDNRVTEESSPYFLLQHRKGHGKSKGFSSIIVGTLDSIFDTKPPPYRILHQTPSSEIYYRKFNWLFVTIVISIRFSFAEIACSLTHGEIRRDWDWLFNNVTETLRSFDNEEDITEFVCCKIQSVLAATQEHIEIEGKRSSIVSWQFSNILFVFKYFCRWRYEII